jgi:hypothetical protein
MTPAASISLHLDAWSQIRELHAEIRQRRELLNIALALLADRDRELARIRANYHARLAERRSSAA